MVNKFKTATKRIAAVAASAAIVSSAAFAGVLNNYPSNFVKNGKFVGQVIVGADAQPVDTVSAQSIIDDLKMEFSGDADKVQITATKSTGASGVTLNAVKSNKALNFGDTLESVSEANGFDDGDTAILKDETFDNGVSNEDYEQRVALKNGKFNYALRDNVDGVDEIVDGIYYKNGDTYATYTFDLKKAIDVADNTQSTKDNFVGKTLTLMGVDYTVADIHTAGATGVDKLVLLGGANKVSLGEGETTTVNVDGQSYEVTVMSVSSDKVLLSVNGQTQSVDKYDTETISGVSVAVTDLVSSNRDAVKGYAEIVVGGQKISLEAGNVKINDKDVNDVYDDYNIDVAFSAAANKLDKFTVTYKVDDDVLLKKGDSLIDPLFKAFTLRYDGLNDVKYSTIRVKTDDDDLTVEGILDDGNSFNQPLLHAHKKSDDTADQVYMVGDNDDDRVIFKDSKVAVTTPGIQAVNATGGTSSPTYWEFNTSSTDLKGNGFLIRDSNNEDQYLYEVSTISTKSGSHDNEVDYDELLQDRDVSDLVSSDSEFTNGFEVSFNSSDIRDDIAGTDSIFMRTDASILSDIIAFKDQALLTLGPNTEQTDLAEVGGSTGSDGKFQITFDSADLDSEDLSTYNPITISYKWDTEDTEFNLYLPNAATEFTNNGLADDVKSNSDDQTYVDPYGVMVAYDNKDRRDVTISVPDQEVKGSASLIFGDAGNVETKTYTVDAAAADAKVAELKAEGYSVSQTTVPAENIEFDISAPVMDNEVTEVKDAIVVGGPAVNAAARALLGIKSYTIDQAGVEPGQGVAKYFADSNSVLVYGYSGDDTKAIVEKLNEGTANFE